MGNYIHVMTRSELFVLMCSGMAAISISILVIYVIIGIPAVHLLTASVMSIPASIFIAKILLPETEKSAAVANPHIRFEKKTANSFDAISKGTMDGLKVGGWCCSDAYFIPGIDCDGRLYLAIVRRWNKQIFGAHLPELSFACILSYVFAPFAYLLGLTGTELWHAGKLLGIKVSINELVAFTELAKSVSITTNLYNFGVCPLWIFKYIMHWYSNWYDWCFAPEKKHTVTQIGLYAVLGSSLANLLSAMIVGLLL